MIIISLLEMCIRDSPNIKLVALTGKAGTGKTLLALAAALGKLTDYKQIQMCIRDRLTVLLNNVISTS